MASELGIETRWLPVACPELNPVDHLWRHVKQDVLANEPTPDLDTSVGYACQYIFGLTPQQRLRKAGVLSDTFWLHKVLQEHVKLLLSKYLAKELWAGKFIFPEFLLKKTEYGYFIPYVQPCIPSAFACTAASVSSFHDFHCCETIQKLYGMSYQQGYKVA